MLEWLQRSVLREVDRAAQRRWAGRAAKYLGTIFTVGSGHRPTAARWTISVMVPAVVLIGSLWIMSSWGIGAEVRPVKFLPASSFALIDQAGRMHGVWSAGEHSRTDLVLVGADGKTPALQLSVGEDGMGSLTFYKNGKPEFVMTAKGAARMSLLDKEESP